LQTDSIPSRYIDRSIVSCLTDRILKQELSSFIEDLTVADLSYHGEPMLYSFVPIIFTSIAKELFTEIAATTCTICEKIMHHFQSSVEYRELWRLDQLSKDLALLPKQYSAPIPIMRDDIFFDPQTGNYKFCEINTDGSSAMNEDRCCAQLVSESVTWAHSLRDRCAQSQELFEPFVDDVIDIFHKWAQGKALSSAPQIAIVDYSEEASIKEFYEFQKRFNNRGVFCQVADINELCFKQGSLFIGDKRINVIYRRAITGSIIKDLRFNGIDRLSKIDGSDCNGVAALVSAAAFDAAIVIGGFQDLLVHNKQIFEVMWSEETWAFLNDKEIEFVQAHIPKTYDFIQENKKLDSIDFVNTKNRWILKPKYGSSTIGVFAGLDCSDRESWIDICNKCLKHGDYIIQEYCDQFSELNIIPQDGSKLLSEHTYVIGLFCYCGKYAGTYVRAGKGAVIGSIRGSAVVASFHM